MYLFYPGYEEYFEKGESGTLDLSAEGHTLLLRWQEYVHNGFRPIQGRFELDGRELSWNEIHRCRIECPEALTEWGFEQHYKRDGALVSGLVKADYADSLYERRPLERLKSGNLSLAFRYKGGWHDGRKIGGGSRFLFRPKADHVQVRHEFAWRYKAGFGPRPVSLVGFNNQAGRDPGLPKAEWGQNLCQGNEPAQSRGQESIELPGLETTLQCHWQQWPGVDARLDAYLISLSLDDRPIELQETLNLSSVNNSGSFRRLFKDRTPQQQCGSWLLVTSHDKAPWQSLDDGRLQLILRGRLDHSFHEVEFAEYRETLTLDLERKSATLERRYFRDAST